MGVWFISVFKNLHQIHTNVLFHITMKIIQLGKKSLFMCMYKVLICIREGNNSVGKNWFLKNLSYMFSLDPYLSNTRFHAYSSGNKGHETSLYHLLLPVDLPWFMLLKILFPIYNFQTFIFLSGPFLFVICFLVCLFCCFL